MYLNFPTLRITVSRTNTGLYFSLVMSKAIESFFSTKLTPNNLAKIATSKTFTPGRRVAPVDKRDDAEAQLRVDAGERIGDKQNNNSQAKNTALEKFAASSGRGTHAKLAVVAFDTKAADREAEEERVVQEMKKQSKDKVG